MIDIDFYQHLLLATWLFAIVFRWLNKRYTTIVVLGIAVLWEGAEYFYNLDAYSNIDHWMLDTLYDLIAATIGCIVCLVVLKEKK
jgi:hypothetical protein